MATLGQLFGIFDRELTPSTCQQIIDRFEADPRTVPGMVGDSKGGGGAVDPRVKATTKILLRTHSRGWEDVNAMLVESLKRRLPACLKLFWEAFPIGIHPEEPGSRVTVSARASTPGIRTTSAAAQRA